MNVVRQALCAALLSASFGLEVARAGDPPARGGGLLGGLMPGDPDPGPPAHASEPRSTPPASPTPEEGADIDRAIEAIRGQIRRQREAPPDRLPALTAEQAETYLRRLRASREERGRTVSERDRTQAEAVRVRAAEFEARWRGQEEAVRENRRPPELTEPSWSTLRDRYFRERSELAADLVELRNRAEGPSSELRAIDDRIAAATALAERLGRMGVASREMARRLHEARIALLERRLAELEQLKAERAGGAVRSNSAAASASPEGGDWYTRTMDWVARQMQLLSRGAPPNLSEGKAPAPLPAWMDRDAPVRAVERQRGRIGWIRTNVEGYERALASASAGLRQADAAALDARREQLETADRAVDPRLADPALAARRADALARTRQELDATGADRLQREKDRIGRELETWRTHLETETARLGNMEREDLERRSVPPSGPDVPQPPR